MEKSFCCPNNKLVCLHILQKKVSWNFFHRLLCLLYYINIISMHLKRTSKKCIHFPHPHKKPPKNTEEKLSPEITLNNAYIAQLTFTTRPQIIQGCIHKIWTTEIGSKMRHCCIHTELANWPSQVLFYHSPKLQLLCWIPNGKTQLLRANKKSLKNLFAWRCKSYLLSLLI